MRKLLILVLPVFLIGCSTLPPVEIHEHKIQEHETVSIVEEINNTPNIEIPEPIQELPAIAAMPAQAPVLAVPHISKETIAENDDITIDGNTPVEYVKKKIKSVIIKKTVEALNSLDSTAPLAPEPEKQPATNPMSAAPGIDTRTGAKVQFFGIDLELWLGQNDSWSTIFKMITFMLVTYGGIRFINSLTGKRRRRLNIL